jgi:chromosome segregation ATPase
MSFNDIEKRSLEAHVDLCAERYKNLNEKLDVIENRLGKFENTLTEIRDCINSSNLESNRNLIKIGTTIFGIFLTAIIGLVVHLATK